MTAALTGSSTALYQANKEDNRTIEFNKMLKLRSLQAKLLFEQTAPLPFQRMSLSPNISQALFGQRNMAEAQFSDKNLQGALDKVDKGIRKLMKQYPGCEKPEIKAGLRGPSYFMEVAIAGQNVDAFGLLLSTEKTIQAAAEKQNGKIITTDSY